VKDRRSCVAVAVERRNNLLVVRQPTIGKDMSREAEYIVEIRYQATTDVQIEN
jgi:ABC-type uncharacterized transport system ATPase subunit